MCCLDTCLPLLCRKSWLVHVVLSGGCVFKNPGVLPYSGQPSVAWGGCSRGLQESLLFLLIPHLRVFLIFLPTCGLQEPQHTRPSPACMGALTAGQSTGIFLTFCG